MSNAHGTSLGKGKVECTPPIFSCHVQINQTKGCIFCMPKAKGIYHFNFFLINYLEIKYSSSIQTLQGGRTSNMRVIGGVTASYKLEVKVKMVDTRQ